MTAADDFIEFFERCSPRLRRALAAGYGEAGSDASATALAYAWQHWDRIGAMSNPDGYVYRIAVNELRALHKRGRRQVPVDSIPEWPSLNSASPFEPGLHAALAKLSAKQRTCVVLHVGFGLPAAEVGQLLGLRTSTVQTHATRALKRVRLALGVNEETSQ